MAIPKLLVENCQNRQALYSTIYAFNTEEQKIILLHYWIGFSITEIAELTKNSPIHIVCILALYLERLNLKVVTFKAEAKDLAYKDVMYIECLFEAEQWQRYGAFLLECEKDPGYKIRFEQTKKALAKILSSKASFGFE